MKKLILLLLVVFSVSLVFAQNQPKPELSKEFYLQKSKRQKNAAWIALGGGLAITTAGVLLVANNFTLFGDASPEANTGAVLTLVGLGSSIASIPLFISAGKNQRKAAEMAYENRPLYIYPNQVNYSQEHAIAFRIAIE